MCLGTNTAVSNRRRVAYDTVSLFTVVSDARQVSLAVSDHNDLKTYRTVNCL